MLLIVMVFIGLSLDNFVALMHVSARIKGMNTAKFCRDSLIFAAMSAAMLSVGYLCSMLVDPIVPNGSFQLYVASQLIILNGILILLRAWFKKKMEEKLDREWNPKKMFRMAIVTNLDTMIISFAFHLLGFPYLFGLIMSGGVSFIVSLLGMNIGYKYGSEYEKPISMLAGILTVLFGFWIMAISVMIKMM